MWNIDLVVRWIPGSIHLVSDHLSRVHDPNVWMLHSEVFEWMEERLGVRCEIDRMATSANKRCERYISYYWDVDTEQVVCFSVSWEGSVSYVNPPFNMVGKVLHHIRVSKARAVVVLPVWESQAWWPMLAALRGDLPFVMLPAREGLFLSMQGVGA